MTIKTLVNDHKTFDDFCEFVTENFLRPAEKQLKQETDVQRIFQLQGKIMAYENMLDLRDTVNGR